MMVSKDVHMARVRTCVSCEHLFRPTLTCRKCGCFMAVKTRLPSASCPLAKWLAV